MVNPSMRQNNQRKLNDPVSRVLVRAAAQGDAEAWKSLMDCYGDRIRAVAASHHLSEADARDIAQTTWLRAVEHLHRLREPERVGAWLVTVARRECLLALRTASRQIPTDNQGLAAHPDCTVAPDAALLESERREHLRRAWWRLTPRDRLLLTLVQREPPLTYAEIGQKLQMPVGSIGPTRARALQRLRENLESTACFSPLTATAAHCVAEVDDRLEAFAADVLQSMQRKDQRHCGVAYIRALIARTPVGQKPSMQQFLYQSPWPWEPVRRRLAVLMGRLTEPTAWIMRELAIATPSRRRGAATLRGLALVAAGTEASCVLNWRIPVSAEWDADGPRGARACVPAKVQRQPSVRLALSMVDEMRDWGIEPPVIVADPHDDASFVQGLAARGLGYAPLARRPHNAALHNLGCDRFEARSYRGWHHHATLVSVAMGFLASERIRAGTSAHRAALQPSNKQHSGPRVDGRGVDGGRWHALL